MPTIAMQRGAPPCLRAVSADPQRHGLVRWDDTEGVGRVAEPVEELVGEARPRVVRHTEHFELATEIADADAEDETSRRQSTERSRHRGDEQRVSVGRHQHVGAEANARRRAQAPRAGRKWLEKRSRQVPDGVVGHRDVIRPPDRVVPELLASRDQLGAQRA